MRRIGRIDIAGKMHEVRLKMQTSCKRGKDVEEKARTKPWKRNREKPESLTEDATDHYK